MKPQKTVQNCSKSGKFDSTKNGKYPQKKNQQPSYACTTASAFIEAPKATAEKNFKMEEEKNSWL